MLDHDGVVVDSFDVYSAALIEVCRRAGVEGVATPDDVLGLLEGNVFESLRALGADDAVVLESVRRSARALRNALPWVKPIPLMPQVLEELGDTHHVAIVSPSDEDVVWAFFHRFRVTRVAEVVGARAGESAVDKITALMHRFPDQETYWFVGDTAGDMRAARLAGATPCGVAWGRHSPELLLDAGAATIVQTPAALLEVVAPGQAQDFWD
jgi:phosphoglycolate phosphatase-like HAD superfamily hydrolase